MPSGLNATPNTPSRALACSGAPTGRPVAGSHSRTVPSPPPLASSVPSGLNATARTPYPAVIWPLAWRVLPTGWPVAGFHSRTVPSPPALASSVPSGLNATPNTPSRALACSGSPTGRPLAVSHCLTVPSSPPLASSLLSGLNATADTVDGSAGSMPCCCCSASRVVIADPAWPVGKTAQAATASWRAVTGLVPSILRLSAASWRDRAIACWWLAVAALCTASWRARKAKAATEAKPMTKAISKAMNPCRRRTVRRWAWLLACRKPRSVWLSGGWRAGSAPIRAAVSAAVWSRVPV